MKILKVVEHHGFLWLKKRVVAVLQSDQFDFIPGDVDYITVGGIEYSVNFTEYNYDTQEASLNVQQL